MSIRQFVSLLGGVVLICAGLGVVVRTRTASPDAPTAASLRSGSPRNAGRAGAAKVVPDQPAVAAKAAPASAHEEPPHVDGTSSPETRAIHSEGVPVILSDSAPKSRAVAHEAPLAGEEPPRADSAKTTSPAASPQIVPDLILVSRSALAKASLSTKESAAIATLRWLASAQAIVQSAGVIDADGDGTGEYGYFGELAGRVPCRAASGSTPELLEPPILDPSFAEISSSGNVLRTGYLFRMYLPGASAGSKTPGLPEAAGGGAARSARPDADASEVLWAVYAWPAEFGATGARAFFLNQEGDILVAANEGGAYDGERRAPPFDAAFGRAHPADMAAAVCDAGAQANDGRAWTPLSRTDALVELPVELGPATQADLDKGPTGDPERVVIRRSDLLRGNMAVDESEALASLRAIADAQFEVQYAAVIDTDGDAQGEFAYFGELAGSVPCRAAARSEPERLQPALLGPSYGKVTRAGNVLRNGYVFRMVLPAATRDRRVPGLAEAAGGGSASDARPDHDACEVRWVVYAWPIEAGVTGRQAFFCNQDGDVLATPNEDGAYSGEEHAPTFDAVFSASSPRDLSAPLPRPGARGNDGRLWSPLGG